MIIKNFTLISIFFSISLFASSSFAGGLIDAITTGELERVKQIVEKQGADIVTKPSGNPPLHFAAKQGHMKITAYFLSLGAPVNALGEHSTTALHLAIAEQHLPIVDILITKGANVNVAMTNGTTPILLVAETGNIKIAELLLGKGADVNVSRKDGITPIARAEKKGHKKLVAMFQKYTIKKRPAVQATISIPERVSPTEYQRRETDERNRLYSLVNNRKLDELRKIIPHLRNDYISFILHVAIYDGYVEAVKLLLESGIDVNVSNSSQETPLGELIKSNRNAEEIFALLIKHGADVNFPTGENNGGVGCVTPLKQAIGKGRIQFVKRLIAHGANVNLQVCDGFDLTPLMVAADEVNDNDIEIIKLLLENGANVNQVMRGSPKSGNAIDFSVSAYKERPAIVKLLLARGATVSSQAIYTASEKGYADILALLLPLRPKKYNLDKALYVAKAGNHNKAAALLEQQGAVLQKTFTKDIEITMDWLIDKAFWFEYYSFDDPEKMEARELKAFIKQQLMQDAENAYLWYLSGRISLKMADWRVFELRESRPAINNQQIKADKSRAEYITEAEASYKKALTFHAKAKDNQRLTRMMLLVMGEHREISAKIRVSALRASLQSGWEHPYEKLRLVNRYSGVDRDSNYMHRSYRKGYDEYNKMIKALSKDGLYEEAIKTNMEAAQLFPAKASKYKKRREYLVADQAKAETEPPKQDEGIDARDEKGNTQLMDAASKGDVITLKFLIERGADVNAENDWYQTALMKAASMGQFEATKIILDAGAHVDTQAGDGMTALIRAVNNKGNNVVGLLLQHGANVNAMDRSRRTPLTYALQRRKKDLAVIKLLRKAGAIEPEDFQQLNQDLLSAVMANDKEQVASLLKQGASANAHAGRGSHENNQSALTVAAGNGDIAIANLLVTYGAMINGVRNQNSTNIPRPLVAAVEHKHYEIMIWLLEKGADINLPGSVRRFSPLAMAAANGDLAIIKELLKRNAQVNTHECKACDPLAFKYSPLLVATENGQFETMHLLRAAGAVIPPTAYDYRVDNAQTKIEKAVHYADITTIKAELSKGVDVNTSNPSGGSLIDKAISKGFYDISLMLIEAGAKRERITDLMLAVMANDIKLVTTLVEKNNNINAADNEGLTALMYAARNGYTNIVKFLLENNVDVDKVSKMQRTALLLALANRHSDLALLLINHGVDSNNKSNKFVLMYAASLGDVELSRSLIKAGWDINWKDRSGNTALASAVYSRNPLMVKLLLDNGANATTRVRRRSSLLITALRNNDQRIALMLLNHGADINEPDRSGYTPIALAIAQNNVVIVEELIKRGVDFKISNTSARTVPPLFMAVKQGQYKIAKLLLEAGVDVNLRTKEGHTALQLAKLYKHKKLIELLKRYRAKE